MKHLYFKLLLATAFAVLAAACTPSAHNYGDDDEDALQEKVVLEYIAANRQAVADRIELMRTFTVPDSIDTTYTNQKVEVLTFYPDENSNTMIASVNELRQGDDMTFYYYKSIGSMIEYHEKCKDDNDTCYLKAMKDKFLVEWIKEYMEFIVDAKYFMLMDPGDCLYPEAVGDVSFESGILDYKLYLFEIETRELLAVCDVYAENSWNVTYTQGTSVSLEEYLERDLRDNVVKKLKKCAEALCNTPDVKIPSPRWVDGHVR